MEQTFYVDRNFSIYVNDMQRLFPFFWPSAYNPILTAEIINEQVILKITLSKIIITFDTNHFCITLPHIEDFYDKDMMCGAFGNIDGDCTDDIVFKNGTRIQSPADCSSPSQTIISEWIGSWSTST